MPDHLLNLRVTHMTSESGWKAWSNSSPSGLDRTAEQTPLVGRGGLLCRVASRLACGLSFSPAGECRSSRWISVGEGALAARTAETPAPVGSDFGDADAVDPPDSLAPAMGRRGCTVSADPRAARCALSRSRSPPAIETLLAGEGDGEEDRIVAGVGVVGVLATGELTRSARLSVGGVTCDRDGRRSGRYSQWLKRSSTLLTIPWLHPRSLSPKSLSLEAVLRDFEFEGVLGNDGE